MCRSSVRTTDSTHDYGVVVDSHLTMTTHIRECRVSSGLLLTPAGQRPISSSCVSDNVDEHSKHIYLVTRSCSAELQCFRAQGTNLHTYLLRDDRS